MASRRGAGERVLESKHVIGLFLLMLVFSGVFFSLGYVMGRNQYDGQVRAAGNAVNREPVLTAKPDVLPKKAASVPAPSDSPDSDPATSVAGDSPWKFEENSKPPKTEPRLEPVPKAPVAPPASKPASAKTTPPVAPVTRTSSTKSGAAPLIPSGALVLQVAALAKQDDALALAASLQKKHFSAYVQPPSPSSRDKFYRVQVGPFRDQKSADATKKGLETAGFKAFYAKH